MEFLSAPAAAATPRLGGTQSAKEAASSLRVAVCHTGHSEANLRIPFRIFVRQPGNPCVAGHPHLPDNAVRTALLDQQ